MSQPSTVVATKEKRRVVLLIAAVLGTAYLIYIISYFSGVINRSTAETAEKAGSAIATALATPHMFCVAIAVIFGWLAWLFKMAGFALAAGILYCVAGALFVVYFPFVLVQLILSFVGYARMKKAKKASA